MIVEKDNDRVFRIEHPTGFIEVKIDGFFPCPVKNGRKIFKMARKFCTEDEFLELFAALIALQGEYPVRIQLLAGDLGNPDLDPADFETTITKLRMLRRDRAGLALNIRDAMGILGAKRCDT